MVCGESIGVGVGESDDSVVCTRAQAKRFETRLTPDSIRPAIRTLGVPTVGTSQETEEEACRFNVPSPILNVSRVSVGPLFQLELKR